jgi:hypothetical protein
LGWLLGLWLLAGCPSANAPPVTPKAKERAAAMGRKYLFKSTFLQISRAKSAPE